MNPLDHKKNWTAFYHQLEAKKELQPKQFEHLAKVFKDILNGVDANEALGLKFARGNSQKKAMARQNMSFILHWVACAIEKDDQGGLGLTLAKAFIIASEKFELIAKYSPEQTEKYWYQQDKAHMQNLVRDSFDQDAPF